MKVVSINVIEESQTLLLILKVETFDLKSVLHVSIATPALSMHETLKGNKAHVSPTSIDFGIVDAV